MTPAEHAKAIENAAEAYAEARHKNGCAEYSKVTSVAKSLLQSAIRAGVGAAPEAPENIRDGAPYDSPEFESMAREFQVWGRASSAMCAQFWLGGMRAAPKP